MLGIGPFADYYFDRASGVHVQAAVGYTYMLGPQSCADALCRSRSSNLLEDYSGSAVSLMTGLGYDWWIGPAFSLGVLGRFEYTTGSLSNPANSKLDVAAPALALQVTGALW
jgi:hypothetical protein